MYNSYNRDIILTPQTSASPSHMETVTSACCPLGTLSYSEQANFLSHFLQLASIIKQYDEKWLHSNFKSLNLSLVDCLWLHFPFSWHMRINSGHSASGIVGDGYTTTGRLTVTGWMKFKFLGSSFRTGETTCKLLLINSRLISVASSSAPDGMLTVQP